MQLGFPVIFIIIALPIGKVKYVLMICADHVLMAVKDVGRWLVGNNCRVLVWERHSFLCAGIFSW